MTTKAGEPTAGAYIRELYLARGLNRHSFSKKIGSAYTTVVAWETRGILPSREKLRAIADALELSAEDAAKLARAVDGETGRAQAENAPTPPEDVPDDLDMAVSRAFRPGVDSVLTAAAVVRTLAPVAPLVTEDADPARKARGYLDAGHDLARQGQPLTTVAIERRFVDRLSAAFDAAVAAAGRRET